MLLRDPAEDRLEEPEGDVEEPSSRIKPAVILIAAVLVLAVPSVIGLVLLRSGSSPDEPRSTPSLIVINQSADGSEVGSEELLRPATETVADERLRYLDADGLAVDLPNGGTIPLGADMNLEVFVAPYPPDTFEVAVDFYVTTSGGDPVEDAEIVVNWDMIFMTHGPFLTEVEHIGGGHYLADFDLFMFGPWEFEALVATGPGEPDRAVMSIYVWPT